MCYESVKRNYDRGLWPLKAVQMALDKGIITQEQFEMIVNPAQDD